MTDFLRLASAFDVLVSDLEMKIVAKATVLSAHEADINQLKRFLDRPEMVSAAGYAEGLHRILRLEIEVKRMNDELAVLRTNLGQAKGRRDKCLSSARLEQAAQERRMEERALGEMMSLGAGTSLAQSENG